MHYCNPRKLPRISPACLDLANLLTNVEPESRTKHNIPNTRSLPLKMVPGRPRWPDTTPCGKMHLACTRQSLICTHTCEVARFVSGPSRWPAFTIWPSLFTSHRTTLSLLQHQDISTGCGYCARICYDVNGAVSSVSLPLPLFWLRNVSLTSPPYSLFHAS